MITFLSEKVPAVRNPTPLPALWYHRHIIPRNPCEDRVPRKCPKMQNNNSQLRKIREAFETIIYFVHFVKLFWAMVTNATSCTIYATKRILILRRGIAGHPVPS
jgi:hypothetical protein